MTRTNPYLELNQRQRKFVDAKMEGKTNREAYREAGYQGEAVDSNASEILNNPKVTDAIMFLCVQSLKGQLGRLTKAAEAAIIVILTILTRSDWDLEKMTLKYKAAIDVLDRLGLTKGDQGLTINLQQIQKQAQKQGISAPESSLSEILEQYGPEIKK